MKNVTKLLCRWSTPESWGKHSKMVTALHWRWPFRWWCPKHNNAALWIPPSSNIGHCSNLVLDFNRSATAGVHQRVQTPLLQQKMLFWNEKVAICSTLLRICATLQQFALERYCSAVLQKLRITALTEAEMAYNCYFPPTFWSLQRWRKPLISKADNVSNFPKPSKLETFFWDLSVFMNMFAVHCSSAQ